MFKKFKYIRGGGGKGGGGYIGDVRLRAPRETSTLNVEQVLNVVDLISEGPIESFVDSEGKNTKNIENLKGIYLNDVPVLDKLEYNGNLSSIEAQGYATPVFNYSQYQYEYNQGNEIQDVLEGFEDVLNEVVISKRVLGDFQYGGSALDGNGNNDPRSGGDFATWQKNLPSENNAAPYTHIVYNSNVKKIIPLIKINSLFDIQDVDAVGNIGFGRPKATTLNVKIEVGFEGEEPTDSYEYDFTSLIQEPQIFELDEVTLPQSGDKKRFVRFNKIQNETESVLINREFEANSVKEIFQNNFTYPNSAIVGSVFDARSYENPPMRNYDMRLKKVQIPSNYFPLENGQDRRFIKDSSEFSYEKELFVFKEKQFLSIKDDINFNLADINFKLRIKIPTTVTSNKKYIFDSYVENSLQEQGVIQDRFSLYVDEDVYYLSIKNSEQDSVLLSGDVSSYAAGSIFDVSGSIQDEQCQLSIFSGESLLVSDSASLSTRENINLEKGLLIGINNDLNFDLNNIPQNSVICNFYFQKNGENLFYLDGRIAKKEDHVYKLIDLENNVDCNILQKSVESVAIITDPESKNVDYGGLHLTRDKIRFDKRSYAETLETEHYNLYQFANYPGISGVSSIPAAYGDFDVSGYLYARNWNRYEIDHWNEDDLWRDDIIQDEYYDATGAYSMRKSHGFTSAKKNKSDTICFTNNMIVRYLKDVASGLFGKNFPLINRLDMGDQWRNVYFDRRPNVSTDHYIHADTYVKYTELFDDPETKGKKQKSIILDNSLYSETTGYSINSSNVPLYLLAGTAQMWGRMHPSVAINPITDKPAVAFFRITGLGTGNQIFPYERFPFMSSLQNAHTHSGALTYMECTGDDAFDLNNWLVMDFPFEDQYGTPQSLLSVSTDPRGGFLDYDYHSENCYISLDFDESGNPGILANGMYGTYGISNLQFVFEGTSGDIYCNYLKFTGQNLTNLSDWNNRLMTGFRTTSPYSLKFDENNNPVMGLEWQGVTDVVYVSGSGHVSDINDAIFVHFAEGVDGNASQLSTNLQLKKNPSTKKIGVVNSSYINLTLPSNEDTFQVYSYLSYSEHTGNKMPFESYDPNPNPGFQDIYNLNDLTPDRVYDNNHYFASYAALKQWGRVHFVNMDAEKDGTNTHTWLSGAGIGFRPASASLTYKKDERLGTGHYPCICYSSFDQNYDEGVNRILRTSLVYLEPTGLNFLESGTDLDDLSGAVKNWAQTQSQLKSEGKRYEDEYNPTNGLYYRGLDEKALDWYTLANWTPFAQTQLGNHYEYTNMFTMNNTAFKAVYEPITTGDTNNLMAGKNHDIYRGDWDGSFKTGWTDNPAWILYDLLTDPNYGAVKNLDEIEDVNVFDLYEIGKYCDAVDESGFFVGLSDGLGGLEPRHSCNIILNESVNAFEAVNRIASSFQGIAYWQNGMINFYCDRPKKVMAEFCNANVLDGVFQYEDINSSERFSLVEVPFLDKDDNFTQKVEYIEDEQRIRQNGIIRHTEPSRGFTSRSAARRFGRHILYSNILETEVVNFSVGNSSLFLRPGDIFSIQDEIKSFDLLSTKILEIDYSNNTFLIDASIDTGIIRTGYDESVSVYCPSGQSGVRDVRQALSFNQLTLDLELIEAINQRQILPFNVSGITSHGGYNKIHLDSNSEYIDFFEFAKIGSFVSFESDTPSKKYYKVISVSPSDGDLYKIQGLEYNEDKFALIDAEFDQFIDKSIVKNIGTPDNLINRPGAPLGFSSSIFPNEVGGFNLTGQITGQVNGSELYYRISLLGSDTSYTTKTVEKDTSNIIGLSPVTDYSFYNLPQQAQYEIEVTSLRNPESSKSLKKTINVPRALKLNNLLSMSKVVALNGAKIVSTEGKDVVIEVSDNEIELYVEICDDKNSIYLINQNSPEHFLVNNVLKKQSNSIALDVSELDNYKIELKDNSDILDYRNVKIIKKKNEIKNVDFNEILRISFNEKVNGELFVHSSESIDFKFSNSNLFKKIKIINKDAVTAPILERTKDRYYGFVFKNKVGVSQACASIVEVVKINNSILKTQERTKIENIFSIRRLQGNLLGPSYSVDLDHGKYIVEIVVNNTEGQELHLEELGIQQIIDKKQKKIKKIVSLAQVETLDFNLNPIFEDYMIKIKKIIV